MEVNTSADVLHLVVALVWRRERTIVSKHLLRVFEPDAVFPEILFGFALVPFITVTTENVK